MSRTMRCFYLMFGLIFLAFVVGYAITAVSAMLAQRKFDNNLADGKSAFEAADCQQAVEKYDLVQAETMMLSELSAASQQEVEDHQRICKGYLEGVAEESAGQSGEAFLLYTNLLPQLQSGALQEVVQGKIDGLLAQSQPNQLVSQSFCWVTPDGVSRLARLIEAENLPQPEVNAPLFYYACGEYYMAPPDTNPNYDVSVSHFSNFLDRYPEHELAEQAKTKLAEAIVAKAESDVNAGQIEQPQAVPGTDSTASVITIENASPQGLRITFLGAEAHVVEQIDPCTTCTNYTVPPEFCPPTEQQAAYTLPPGVYQVVVESFTGGDVIPFRGTWTLDAGFEYPQCFFIVETLQP